MVAYTEEIYQSLWDQIAKRIGEVTVRTITMMGRDDFDKYGSDESIERLVTPMLGLFGRIITKGMVVDAFTGKLSDADIEEFLVALRIVEK